MAFCSARHGISENGIAGHAFQKAWTLKIFYITPLRHAALPLQHNRARQAKFMAYTLVREPQTLYICA